MCTKKPTPTPTKKPSKTPRKAPRKLNFYNYTPFKRASEKEMLGKKRINKNNEKEKEKMKEENEEKKMKKENEEEKKDEEEEEDEKEEYDDKKNIEFYEKNKKEIQNIFKLDDQFLNGGEFYHLYKDLDLVNFIIATEIDENEIVIDTNVNFVKKYKIFYINKASKVTSKILNQKKYKKRHKIKIQNNNFLNKILFPVEDEKLDKFFWYLYVVPHELLMMFYYMFKTKKNISTILSDIKNYFLLIFRCGGLDPFGKYVEKNNK